MKTLSKCLAPVSQAPAEPQTKRLRHTVNKNISSPTKRGNFILPGHFTPLPKKQKRSRILAFTDKSSDTTAGKEGQKEQQQQQQRPTTSVAKNQHSSS